MRGSITFSDGTVFNYYLNLVEMEAEFEPVSSGPRSAAQEVASSLFPRIENYE